jgi:hypothetical protein
MVIDIEVKPDSNICIDEIANEEKTDFDEKTTLKEQQKKIEMEVARDVTRDAKNLESGSAEVDLLSVEVETSDGKISQERIFELKRKFAGLEAEYDYLLATTTVEVDLSVIIHDVKSPHLSLAAKINKINDLEKDKDKNENLLSIENVATTEKTVEVPYLSKKQRQQKFRDDYQQRSANKLLEGGSLYKNNIFLVARKLMILDLNKVIIFRKQATSRYILRPHAMDFLREMAQRFTLAVWTSMSAKCAKSIINEIFTENKIPLLFRWYQPRCIRVEPPQGAKPSMEADSNTYFFPSAKPMFLKKLSQVWSEYREYNEHNTVSS